MSEWVTPVVSVLSVLVSYRLGWLQSRISYRNTQLRARYEAFYIPYLSKLYAGHLWDAHLQATEPLETRGIFFDLIMNNIQYLGISSQSLVPDFYDAFLDMLEFDENNPDYTDAPLTYEKVFRAMTEAVLTESTYISRKLKLPPLSHTISKHAEDTASHKKHAEPDPATQAPDRSQHPKRSKTL